MRKPNNYEETQVQGEFTPVELGGHKLVIKQVEERMSKTNKPMIVVFFDFAPGDKQAVILRRLLRMTFVQKRDGRIRQHNTFLRKTKMEIVAGHLKHS